MPVAGLASGAFARALTRAAHLRVEPAELTPGRHLLQQFGVILGLLYVNVKVKDEPKGREVQGPGSKCSAAALDSRSKRRPRNPASFPVKRSITGEGARRLNHHAHGSTSPFATATGRSSFNH